MGEWGRQDECLPSRPERTNEDLKRISHVDDGHLAGGKPLGGSAQGLKSPHGSASTHAIASDSI